MEEIAPADFNFGLSIPEPVMSLLKFRLEIPTGTVSVRKERFGNNYMVSFVLPQDGSKVRHEIAAGVYTREEMNPLIAVMEKYVKPV